jgi:hypothetical protein
VSEYAKALGSLANKKQNSSRARETLFEAQPAFRPRSIAAGQNQTGEHNRMDEGRKCVLVIVAGILVARHLKNPEDLGDSRASR